MPFAIQPIYRIPVVALPGTNTSVLTSCSTSSGVRVSVKHPAKRAVSRIVRSVSPSSDAPASDVIAPPSNAATTSVQLFSVRYVG
jgi:hypothetical protein